jgi:hypothetical protein
MDRNVKLCVDGAIEVRLGPTFVFRDPVWILHLMARYQIWLTEMIWRLWWKEA